MVKPEESKPGKAEGIQRFHKLTISMGAGFCALMAATYWRSYQDSQDSHQLTLMALALAGGAALLLYLVYFWRRGIQ